MAEYTVSVKGAEAILRKLTPALYTPALVAFLTRLSLTAEAAARGLAPVDTAALARSITSQVTPPTARVFSTLGYAPVVELGRAPGSRPPPPEALRGWAMRHGFTGSLWALARAIGRRGTKGRFFMRGAAQAAQRAAPALLLQVVEDIESAWAAR